MRLITPTLSICALAAAFTAGALTAGPARQPAAAPAAQAAVDAGPLAGHGDHGTAAATPTVTAPANGAEPVITISSFAFETSAVSAGDTVRIVNLDSAPHTVTANDGTFSVFVDAGAETTFTAPAAGTYAFFCEVHPSMTGVLAVA